MFIFLQILIFSSFLHISQSFYSYICFFDFKIALQYCSQMANYKICLHILVILMIALINGFLFEVSSDYEIFDQVTKIKVAIWQKQPWQYWKNPINAKISPKTLKNASTPKPKTLKKYWRCFMIFYLYLWFTIFSLISSNISIQFHILHTISYYYYYYNNEKH